ncbi:hypothetical protein THARTR1_06167 [Trichoderma harzianum]|uniref:Uncharacterized protein n=1 Tax=Trichoderma harzianum TaxID=5544 RepID=A0A2K0U6R2_TRIHA|nr:hypothetical protein THARTR1_06167 [Trichoderma harzianum]
MQLPHDLDSFSALHIIPKLSSKANHESESIMLPTTIRSPPAEADYTPLVEYQSQTPESFTDGKPILHYHLAGAKATIPRSQCGSLAVFPQDTAAAPNDSSDGEAAEELVEQTVDVFATSECVLPYLFV